MLLNRQYCSIVNIAVNIAAELGGEQRDLRLRCVLLWKQGLHPLEQQGQGEQDWQGEQPEGNVSADLW